MLRLREETGDLLSVRIRNAVIQRYSLPRAGATSASGLEANQRPVPAHSRFFLVSAPLFLSGGVHVAEDHLSWGRRLAARPLALPVGFPLGAGEPPHAFLRDLDTRQPTFWDLVLLEITGHKQNEAR